VNKQLHKSFDPKLSDPLNSLFRAWQEFSGMSLYSNQIPIPGHRNLEGSKMQLLAAKYRICNGPAKGMYFDIHFGRNRIWRVENPHNL
jgi:hypothetical protein